MCTDFILPFDGDQPTIISGRTMDFSKSPDQSYVTIAVKVPAGLTFQAFAPKKNAGYRWKNSYGFVGLTMVAESTDAAAAVGNDVSNDVFIEGLNQQGLSVAGLWLSYTEYAKNITESDYSKCLDADKLVSYLLGTCASVDDVQEKLDQVIVWLPDAWQRLDPIHLSIHDRNGKSLVVEFINGQKLYYNNNDIGVLTNEPTFDWHAIQYNYFYNALTCKDNKSDKYVKLKQDEQGRYNIAYGSGYQYEVLSSGMFGLPGDSSSPSRFARAGKLRNCVPAVYDSCDGVQYALQVLSRVAVCEQEVLLYFNASGPYHPRNTYNPTLWMTVRDHTNIIFYYGTDLNHNIQAIKLDELDFSQGSAVSSTPIASADWYNDSTSRLQ